MPNAMKLYLKTLQRDLVGGKATEHTHRPALKTFIESILPKIQATNEPKRTQCGAPDFVVSQLPHMLTVGYIEAKDVGVSLDEAERSEQVQRYLRSLGNFLLTDYLEFRWYVEGEYRSSARLARMREGGRLLPDKHGKKACAGLLVDFLQHPAVRIGRPDELAQRMARLTHMIRDIIVEAFDKAQASPLLRDLRKAFTVALIPDLDQPEKTSDFADMYAQTIAYGLFAARCNHDEKNGLFQRLGAAAEIPKTNPFLRRLFETITGTELNGEPYAGFVDDLVQVLAHADMEAVLEHFGKRTRRQDPMVHFYETFLATYDPIMREARGVYYTPEPVVSYIVRSVDHILQESFGLKDGLADTTTVEYERKEQDADKIQKNTVSAPRVLILDPACGTGTFLYAVVDHIREQFMMRGDAGMWSGYVKRRLLPRLFGFELLMAPYAMAHFKLGMQLAGQDLSEKQREIWAYDFSGEERVGIYLTNTLEEAEHKEETLFGPLRVITDEANAAARIKQELPIMVILGNPPYSANSFNKGKWITNLIQSAYYPKDEIKEHNPRLLLDDYVKFIRWAQWRIERTGAGILGFITNHSYLDNPTFRQMRLSLMQSFDEIYLLDLHGSSKKKEKSPDGSRDENVFDIQQGVALGIFVKRLEGQKTARANVYHCELWGTREQKSRALFDMNISNTPWNRLDPQRPFYLFVPFNTSFLPEYEKCWRITDICPLYSTGFKTHRDHFVIDFDRENLEKRIKEFRNLAIEDLIIRQNYRLPDTRDWKLSQRRRSLNSLKDWHVHFTECLYRPFDIRHIYYHPDTVELPRPEVMRHIQEKGNIALIACRQLAARKYFSINCTNRITELSSQPYAPLNIFPIYLYPDPEKDGPLFSNGLPRHPNLSRKFIIDFSARLNLDFIIDGKGDLNKTFGPEDVFHYIYALLHSPSYRERYAEFLKIDFPRIPLTSRKELFASLCALGRELVGLHLIESPELASFITRYPVPGKNRVESGYPRYSAPGQKEPVTAMEIEQGRVYINKEQYFEGVPQEVWDFYVGGYQVCHKWLKDRRGRELAHDDLTHYQKIVAAIARSIRLMGHIDRLIDVHGGWPGAF